MKFPFTTSSRPGVMSFPRGFAAESRAYFAAQTTRPTEETALLDDAFIRGLQADGLWPLIRGLYIHAADTEQANRINMKVPSEVAANSGTVLHTSRRGVMSGSATGHIDTGILATAFATVNNVLLATYENTNVAEDTPSIGISGATNALRIYPRFSPDRFNMRVNDTTSSAFDGITDSRGLSVAQRNGAGARQAYKNGVLFNSDTTAATAVPVGNITILRHNAAYAVNRRVALSLFGSAFTGPQQAALYSRILARLTPVGAN